MRRTQFLLTTMVMAIAPMTVAFANPTPKKDSGLNLSNAVGINELKIQMAESRLKLLPNQKAVSDLVVALEEFLNTSCMGNIQHTLTYAGNPTNPSCISRMQKILEINPGNPVGLCVRDGIGSEGCIEAYKNQKLQYHVQGSSDPETDPVLKVGLSAADTERLTKILETLKGIDDRYQKASEDAEKKKLLDDAALIYDQALSVACKVSALQLKPIENTDKTSEPIEVTQARERLLQVPSALRTDYQREMANKVQKELETPNLSADRQKTLREVLKVIDDPTAVPTQDAAHTVRTRIVLEQCYELIEQAKAASPNLPSPICHQEGWYSPQCILALKRWRILKQQEESGGRGKGTPAPVATSSMISTF